MACLVRRLAHEGQVHQVLRVFQEVKHPQGDGRIVAQHAFRRKALSETTFSSGIQESMGAGPIFGTSQRVWAPCEDAPMLKHQHILQGQPLV
jgi:hypothetical protein